MKKILYSAAAMALAFFAVSCQQENLEPVAKPNTVTYTVQVADAATKALGDEVSAINELVYEVYRTEAEETTVFTDVDNLLYHKTATVIDGVAHIELDLINDQNYTVLFWAHVAGNDVYNVDDLTKVQITSPDAANNVEAQAFVGRDFLRDCVADSKGKVTLVRPISQLNIATTPESLVKFNDVIGLDGSSVKVSGLATSYNIASLSAFGETATEYEYTETAVPTDVLTVNGVDYTYVAMNYIGFAPAEGTADVTVSYVINTTEGNIDNEIVNVPVKPNYRTNIVGNLITSKTEYEITLENNWYEPETVLGDAWSQTGDYNYTVNEGAPAATLADVLAHADAAAKASATKAAGPVVIIELAEDVEWETGAGIGSTPLLPEDSPISAVVINGNGKTFTATGKGVGQVRLANGALLTFNNVKVVDESVSYAENSWEYGYLEFGGNLAFDGCEFVNAAMIEGESAAFVDCSFNSFDANQYAVWVNEGVTSFEGCTFAGARGLKIHEAYGSEVASVVVDGCTFSELTKKPGVAIGDLNAETSVTIQNSTFDRCQAGDQGLFIYETDTDVTTFTFVCENNFVIPVGDEPYVQEDGTIIVATAEALKAAIAAAEQGATIVLADGTFEGLFYVNGKSLNFEALNAGEATINGKLAIAAGGKTINVKGIVFENSYAGSVAAGHQYLDKTGKYCIGLYCASVNVEGCTFNLSDNGGINFYAINAPERCTVKNSTFNCNGFRPIISKADLTVDGCTFNDQYKYSLQVWGNANTGAETVVFTNNTINEAGKTSGCADVYKSYVSVSKSYELANVAFTISGNTPGYNFVYDNNAKVNITSCTLNGAAIVAEQCYSVASDIKEVAMEYKAGYTYVGNSDELNAAVKAATAGGKIMLAAGTYKMTAYKAGVKIEGADKAKVIVDVKGAKFGVHGDVNIENVTLQFADANYTGFQHTATEVYTNCNIEGQPFLYGENVTYNSCVFTQPSSGAYNVWTYGAKNVTFNDCTFNSAGKSVLVYTESGDGSVVTFNNSVLNASAPVDGKAAVEIDSSLISGKYVVNINNTTANGFANGNVSGNSLWNHKKGSKAEVYVDGILQ